MKNQTKYFITAFILILVSSINAQQDIVDSLKNALKIAKHDTIKIRIRSEIGETAPILRVGYWDSIANDAHKYSLKMQEAHAFNNIGYIQKNEGNISDALEYYNRSLKLFTELNDKTGTATAYNNLASLYNNLANVSKALDLYHRSLKIREELADKKGVANTLNNIGFIYDEQKNYEKTLEYYKRSLKIRKEIDDKKGVAQSINNIALVYQTLAETANRNSNKKTADSLFSLAFDNLEKSLAIRVEIDDKKGAAQSYNNMGATYALNKDYKKALDYYHKSLAIKELLKDKKGIAHTLHNIGTIYSSQDQNTKALDFFMKSLQIAKEIENPESIRNAAQSAYTSYKELGAYQKALEMKELQIIMRDSIDNEENRKAGIQKQLQYEYETKVAADKIRAIEEKKVAAVKLEQEQTKRYALYGGLLLTVVFGLFMVNRLLVTKKQKKIIEHQKHVVEEKQKEIIDSINYAKRIQQSLMPTEKYISSKLKSIK
jgi:tetratricopeptide (TPR) repeat protein